ncbi:MAG: MATE family efflux transporter [Pseudomonadota bacterium]
MAARDLTQGGVAGSLFRLTAPMMLAVSSSIVVQMIEIGFIGQLGTAELAAITFTFPLVMILNSVALGIGIGTSSVIARTVGSGERDVVRRLGTHALFLVAGVLSLLSLIGWLTIDAVFTALGADATTLPLIHEYLDIYYPSVVMLTLSMVAGNVLRANGNAGIPGLIMTCGAMLNLALDPVLIFGWFGLPRMELAGAATANALSRVFMVTVLLTYLYRTQLVATTAVFQGFFASARQILTIGIPAIATQMIGPVSAAIITRMLAGHGEVVVAGFGVATRIEAVSIMLLFALSGSIGPFVGQNWGAGRKDRVQQGLNVSYQFSIAWGAVAALLVYVFGVNFAGLVDDNEEVVRAATIYLAIVPWTYGLWGVLMMASASFNALGKPLPSTALSFTRMFILYVPLALVMNRYFGYQGIFYATAISNGVMGVLGYIWFRNRFFPAPKTAVAQA